ncbi:MAG TPA: hypothetical protein VMR70_02750 [Flavisolibacter sp.]|nr:hypothetical protein [Flavisolibacter sp.]
MILGILFFSWTVGMLSGLFNTGGSTETPSGANFIHLETPDNPVGASVAVFSRYMLFFAIMPMFLLHVENEKFVNRCQQIFELFLYANCVAIIVGYIFNISFFSSYNPKAEETLLDARFGYKGLLYGINETTGVFFLAFAHVYRELFLFRKKKYLLLATLILASLLTGTKGCIIALVLVSSYYLFRYQKALFFSIVIPAVIAGTIFLIQIDFVEQVTAFLNIFWGDDFSTTPFGAVLTLLMTGRNIYIYNNWLYMLENWSVLNFLFGDGLLYSETDLMDLYYCFGLGTIAYLWGYTRLTFFRQKQFDLIFIFIFLLLLAFTGGHIIRSAVFPVFFCLYLIAGYRKVPEKTLPVHQNHLLLS